ncbi:hypothetical protein DRF65_11125 [Chryseobacterium pennae]|uniref:Zinc-binding dehydrogenase n=1 Tax=Chryseobacterium pennae TaxID=2258962 RepID=A0A3D9C8R1_9FLAO|nr:zinc-binding dehydrogenase [Chryseobacterium pennae]REC62257.1 hypothetical protein DRF65_11125 [Chryseobacterium pennae]
MLKHITELVEQGKVRPLIDEYKFSFEQIAKAHQYAESGNPMGKVVLTQQ